MNTEPKKYWERSNEVSLLRLVFSHVILGILFIGGLFIFFVPFELIKFSKDTLIIYIILGSVGIFICLISIYGYKSMKRYLEISHKEELQEEGYFTSTVDKRTNKKEAFFIPYEKMDFVLFSLGFRTEVKVIRDDSIINGSKHMSTRIDYYVIANVHIKGVTSESDSVILPTIIETKKLFNKWIEVLEKKGVPIYCTKYDISNVPLTEESIKELPMEPYKGKLPFTIEKYVYEPGTDFELKTEKAIEKEKKKLRYSKIFILTLGFLQIPLTGFLLPKVNIVDGNFESVAYDSIYLIIAFLLIFLNVIVEKRKWYEPITDILIIGLGGLIGILLANEISNSEYLDALFLNFFAAAYIYLPVVYINKLYDWYRKNTDGSPK